MRHDHPYGVFRFAHIPVATAWAGDVLARTLVRWLEVQRSLEFVIDQVGALPRGGVQVECGPSGRRSWSSRWRKAGGGRSPTWSSPTTRVGVRRHKVVDPSFHNWSALAAAMPGNQISDFPLCNKSFNLSYAGHDL